MSEADVSQEALRSIAEQVGVSLRTVQRVLACPQPYQRPTIRRRAQRIRQLATELNYLPNAAAKAIGSGRHNAMGLLISNSIEYGRLPERLLNAVLAAMSQRGIRLSLEMLPDEVSASARIPSLLASWCVDGLLIDYTHRIPPRMVETIRSSRIPSIWLNTALEADCVLPDDLVAARSLTSSLIAKGHRRIAYFDFSHAAASLPVDHYSARERLTGYRQAMLAAGLEPRSFMREEGGDTAARAALAERLLDDPQGPTAVIGYGGGHLMCMVEAMRRRGLGHSHVELACLATWPYMSLWPATAMAPADAELGAAAVEALAAKLESPARALPPRRVPFVFRQHE